MSNKNQTWRIQYERMPWPAVERQMWVDAWEARILLEGLCVPVPRTQGGERGAILLAKLFDRLADLQALGADEEPMKPDSCMQENQSLSIACMKMLQAWSGLVAKGRGRWVRRGEYKAANHVVHQQPLGEMSVWEHFGVGLRHLMVESLSLWASLHRYARHVIGLSMRMNLLGSKKGVNHVWEKRREQWWPADYCQWKRLSDGSIFLMWLFV